MEYSTEYSMEYSVEYSMEYENQQNGIFQKTTTTTLNSIFLEYGIFQEYSKKNLSQVNFSFFWNMEYHGI